MKQQDAIALLKADHKTVKALFKQTEELSDRAKSQRQKLGEQICKELTIHTQIEEQILYPRTKERAGKKKNKEESDLVLESYEEHAIAKHVIADLRAIDGSDESYKPKLKVSERADRLARQGRRERDVSWSQGDVRSGRAGTDGPGDARAQDPAGADAAGLACIGWFPCPSTKGVSPFTA